jgi:hypothetical protein
LESETILSDTADDVAAITLNRQDHPTSFDNGIAVARRWALETVRIGNYRPKPLARRDKSETRYR